MLWRNPVVAERLRQVRRHAMFALQSGVAAAVAWLVAHGVGHHPQPVFAPIAAVIVLGAGKGQRWQRALELVAGVALGVVVGAAVVLLVGVGVLQIAGVVILAVLLAVLLGGEDLAIVQAAASAVLVVTLAPRNAGFTVGRLLDALIGGAVGLAIMALVLPYNPLSRVRRVAGGALSQLAEAVLLTASGLRSGDPGLPQRALADLRAGEGRNTDLSESLTSGQEAATLSPMEWRTRSALGRYGDAAVHVERATRDVRVLVRRGASVLTDGEPVPEQLPSALDALAGAVSTLREELAEGREPAVARERTLEAVRAAGAAYEAGVGFSGSVMVAQVRSAAFELLLATGLAETRADRLVAAAAEGPPARPAAGG
jgi:uncharacterized membrane protein YgaE (UPF0421/DUF939 family)